MIREIQKLFEYDQWAITRELDLLAATSNEIALKKISHILAAKKIWLLRLRGEDSSGVDTAPVISLEECGELSRELFDGYQRFLASLDAAELQDAISYKNTRGELFKTPIGEILVHVALHAAYHRGQVAHVLRANDQTPVNTDFITFTRL